MTSIDKLLIKGIRSFSPNNQNVIDFYKPLTIIVGTNGAGKTTIIECLKFCCTGEMPPNSKNGQAFIHDPKVAGEREVKAQIKMAFKGVNGKNIVCIRSLQLTQKPNNKQEVKTLEGALKSMNEAGEKVSSSYRCADLDREVPELMGVSKAILENVIFCHQEESNWPLGDPATLKKKFDDIFASTRYTKALDVIKKQKKELTQQLKESRLRLETVQVQLNMCRKLQDEITVAREKISATADDIKEAEKVVGKVQSTLSALKARNERATQAVQALSSQRAVLMRMQSEAETAKSQLSVDYTETDDELHVLEQKFDHEVAALTKDEEAKTRALDAVRAAREQLDQQLNDLNRQAGILQTQLQTQRSHQNERDRIVSEFASRMQMTGFTSGPFTAEQVANVVTIMGRSLAAAGERIDSMRAQAREDLERFANKQQSLQAEIGQLSERKSTASSQLRDCNAKITRIKRLEEDDRKLCSGGPVNQMANVAQRLAQQQAALDDLTRQKELERIDGQIDVLDQQRGTLMSQSASLSDSLSRLNKGATVRHRVEALRTELHQRADALEGRCSAFSAKVATVPSLSVQREKWLPVLREEIAERRAKLSESKAKHHNASMSLSALDGQLQAISRSIADIENRIASKQATLAHLATHSKPLPDLIAEKEKLLEKMQRDVAQGQSASTMLREFVRAAQSTQCCPLCERAFSGSEETKQFVGTLEHKMVHTPEQIDEHRRKLSADESQLKALRNLRVDWEALQKLQSFELPAAHDELNRLQQQRNNASATADECSHEWTRDSDALEGVSAFLPEAEGISRDICELEHLRMELSSQEEKLSRVSSDPRTLSEVTKEYQELQTKTESLNSSILLLRESRERHLKQKHDLEATILELKNEQQSLQAAATASAQRGIEIRELEAQSVGFATVVAEASQRLTIIEAELAAVVSERSRYQEAAAEREMDMQKQREMLQGTLLSIKAVPPFEKSVVHLEKEVEEVSKRVATLSSSRSALDAELKQKQESLSLLQQHLNARDVIRRNLVDNIKYRKLLRDVHDLSESLKARELESDMREITQLASDIQAAEAEFNSAQMKKAKLVGTREVLTSQVTSHEAELQRAAYASVEEENRKLQIQIKTTEMATVDLDKYYHALDKALMKYHGLKMDEINKIIKELWQSTYRGQDIDTIEIRADVGDSAKTRSYNYRVVMLKGETELDMRGRCSAGQKVLASLVIRLALAETFCLNCGILALDEPTTNLDRNNVNSFAQALSKIIETRRQQSNFQLIVITHDEEFVQLMGKSENSDYYWRVTKNANGHTQLERQSVRDM